MPIGILYNGISLQDNMIIPIIAGLRISLFLQQKWSKRFECILIDEQRNVIDEQKYELHATAHKNDTA